MTLNTRKRYKFCGQWISFKQDPHAETVWNSKLKTELLVRLIRFADGWSCMTATTTDLDYYKRQIKEEGREIADALRNWHRIGISKPAPTPQEAITMAEKITLAYFRRLGAVLGYEVER